MKPAPLVLFLLLPAALLPACQEGREYAETVAGGLDRGQQAALGASFQTLATALESYQIDGGAYPESLSSLPEVASGRFRAEDPWGAPLRYRRTGGGYEVLSDGPDGRPGTEDDVALRDGRVE